MRRLFPLALIAILSLGALSCGGKGESETETAAASAPDSVLTATEIPAEGVVWMSFAEGQARAAAEGKPMVVDFWTTWCHWCKVMDKDTYSDATIQRRLAEGFIAVKVNAESPEVQGGEGAPTGVDLARSFQVNSYPTTWFVDSKGEKIAPLPGFVPPDRFALVLDYISSAAYKTQSFQEYQAGLEG
ncbi:MAG: thioredoxin fold domain-containing protein [Candidatus Krumholzibacteriia bacterium]|nr:thioredoxin fold domain-containing protein [bacterium]MCB9515698.1 thioredoxin fold domain-containing protein [Candidatus Latescibacterota bacterium]